MKKMDGLEFLNGIPVEREAEQQHSELSKDSFRSDPEEEEDVKLQLLP